MSLKEPVGRWVEVEDPNQEQGMTPQEIEDLLAKEVDGVEPSWFEEDGNG